MLQTSSENSFMLANYCLSGEHQTICPQDQAPAVALAHLQSSAADCKAYMDVAPPDARQLRAMIVRYLILSFVLKGKDGISPDLKEIKETRKRLELVDRISGILYDRVKMTQQRLVLDIIVKQYEEGAKVWDPVFEKFEDEHETLEIAKAGRGLEQMMEELRCGGHEEPRRSKGHYLVPENTKLCVPFRFSRGS